MQSLIAAVQQFCCRCLLYPSKHHTRHAGRFKFNLKVGNLREKNAR